jgi:hypothetical protein
MPVDAFERLERPGVSTKHAEGESSRSTGPGGAILLKVWLA